MKTRTHKKSRLSKKSKKTKNQKKIKNQKLSRKHKKSRTYKKLKGGVRPRRTKPISYKSEKVSPKLQYMNRLDGIVNLPGYPIKSLNRAFVGYSNDSLKNMSSDQHLEIYQQWRAKEAGIRKELRYRDKEKKTGFKEKNDGTYQKCPYTKRSQGKVSATKAKNTYFSESGPLDPIMENKLLENVELEDIEDIEYINVPTNIEDEYRPGTPAYDDDEKIADILLDLKNIKLPNYKKELESDLDLDLLDDYNDKYDDK